MTGINSRDQQYLIDAGWRLVTTQRQAFGKIIYYWDHDKHQREDGRWWPQGSAVIFQRELSRHGEDPCQSS